MYPNLNAERVRQGVKVEDLASDLGVTVSTMSLKLNGKAPITLIEAKKIKQKLKTTLPIETLFSTEAINT